MLIEYGKYPLCMKVYIHIIRYWIRLQSLDNKYMQEMFDIDLQKKMNEEGCWLKIVEYLMKYVNYDIEYYDISKDKILKNFNKILKRNLKQLTNNVGQKKGDHLMNQNSFFCASINVILCLSLISQVSNREVEI